jgi:putative membrane protein insertion efficiency factor
VMAPDRSLPWLTRWVLAVLRTYKRRLSGRLPMVCRYSPSCSVYAAESVRRHGVRAGLGLAYRRIRRCNPSGGRGVDPVPEDLRD